MEDNRRGFYCVITQDRISDLNNFLHFLLKFNNYPVYVALADDEEDAYRKKTMIGALSPFLSTVYLDTDILINGNLDFLFEKAEQGFIAAYRETLYPFFNAGVFTLPEKFKSSLSQEWLSRYNKKKNKPQGCFDQDIFNELIQELPLFPLDRTYNCILKEITPDEEARIFKSTKIFHFLHGNPSILPNYKSWRVYNGADS